MIGMRCTPRTDHWWVAHCGWLALCFHPLVESHRITLSFTCLDQSRYDGHVFGQTRYRLEVPLAQKKDLRIASDNDQYNLTASQRLEDVCRRQAYVTTTLLKSYNSVMRTFCARTKNATLRSGSRIRYFKTFFMVIMQDGIDSNEVKGLRKHGEVVYQSRSRGGRHSSI